MYPGHVAGSLCGAALTTATPAIVTTIPTSTIPSGASPSTSSSTTATTGERNSHDVTLAGSSQRSELK